MARPILLSNGEMHVGLNHFGQVHDFFYPYVGQENHAAAKQLRHRVGVYVNGKIYWLDEEGWSISCRYYDGVLVSRTTAQHDEIGIRLEFDDCVDSKLNVFLRNIQVINMSDVTRDIRLFLHQVFVISNSHLSDTVQYLPDDHVIMHYKGHRTLYVNARHASGELFDDYSVGLFGIEGRDGTYRDADDGVLSKNSVEHGQVDSVLGLYMTVAPQSSQRVHYWVAAGKSQREASQLNNTIQSDGLLHHVLSTANDWSHAMAPVLKVSKRVPEKYRNGFINSALFIKAAIDKRGAVMASTDTTMLNYSRDSYVYCWPRDAVYVLWPLMRLGFTTELVNFFSFCRRVKHPDGYLNHKFQADGSVGSSWHPYTHAHRPSSPPIQTDETAAVVFLFGQYFRLHNDKELLQNFYATLVEPMTNFLAGFIGEDKLPNPSYDLWEEKYLTTTYTTALTFAALQEAVYLAEQIGDRESAVRWQAVAEDMQEVRDRFFDEDTSYFIKGYIHTDQGLKVDKVIDSSSLFGVFMYGYFEADDPRCNRAYETLRQNLLVDEVAVIRYTDDIYHKSSDEVANPWPVTSLWLAQYALEKNDTKLAEKVLDWITGLMGESGSLAEQYVPHTDITRSVDPLTWSHAEYMSAILDMITEKRDEEKAQ